MALRKTTLPSLRFWVQWRDLAVGSFLALADKPKLFKISYRPRTSHIFILLPFFETF